MKDRLPFGFRGDRLPSPLVVVALALSLPSIFVLASGAEAQNYSVVYSFQCGPNDGQNPDGDLIADSAGNLYGTTYYGGAFGEGTVFELSASGVETVLYSFGTAPTDGVEPMYGLARDPAGNLYGTNSNTLFEISPNGTETVLQTFTGGKGGGKPVGDMLRDSLGNLYGATSEDGSFDGGTVYRFSTATEKENVLYSFGGTAGDAANPSGGLLRGSAGQLYGNAGGGAGGLGSVYEVSKPSADTVLYSFGGPPDGMGPIGSLVRDAAGNLYGATLTGGLASSCGYAGDVGCGTVFKVTPSGEETVLYTFKDGTDGGIPYSGLVIDSKGNLYGTASQGGVSSGDCAPHGQPLCGLVFEVTTSGTERVLHSFTGTPGNGAPPDGETPIGGLLRLGNYLYGTTYNGGAHGCGTVYRLTP